MRLLNFNIKVYIITKYIFQILFKYFFLFKIKLSKPGKGKGDGPDTGSDEFEAWLKSKQLVRPDDQLDLTEAELSEEIPKMLTCDNPNIKSNLVIYSFKTGGYVHVSVNKK